MSEEAHYWTVLSNFVSLIEDHGAGQIMTDFKSTSLLNYQRLEDEVKDRIAKAKTAALFAYKDAFFSEANVETNS